MPEGKKKRWAENITFWTALLTFVTTVIDKVSDMFKKDSAIVPTGPLVEMDDAGEVMGTVVESYVPQPSFSWSIVLMSIAVFLIAIIAIIKMKRRAKARRAEKEVLV